VLREAGGAREALEDERVGMVVPGRREQGVRVEARVQGDALHGLASRPTLGRGPNTASPSRPANAGGSGSWKRFRPTVTPAAPSASPARTASRYASADRTFGPPALLGAASGVRAAQPSRAVVVALLAWIGASLVLFMVQGRLFAHYAIPLAVPLGVLAGVGLQRVAESLRRAAASGARAVVVLPLLVTLVVSAAAGVLSASMEFATVSERSGRMEAVAERIEHLPGASLLVWGNEPRLYDLSGRTPATRYAYLYPLTTPGYSTAAMVDDLLSAWTADPPAVVVDAGSSAPGRPGFLPLLIDRPILTDGRDLDLLDPLRAFVRERYVLIDTVAGWPIYVYSVPDA